MRNTFTVFWKEFRALFHNPVAMLIIPFFLAIQGIYFYSSLVNFQVLTSPRAGVVSISGANVNKEIMAPLFDSLLNLLFLAIPVITMRFFAEEKRMNNLELLLSYPVKLHEILIGKYLCGMLFSLVLLSTSLIYPVILSSITDPDWGPIWASYIGIFLFLMFYVAVGTLTSILTENQIIAALLCLGGILSLFFVRWLAFISFPPLSEAFAHLLLLDHLSSFFAGTCYLSYFIVYPSVTLILLYLAYWRLNIRG